MYTEYFGLREPPFSIAPDPRYLYMSQHHREALAHLLYGIQSEGGFVLLTGEVGTGKTTICRCLLERLPENVDVAFIINPKMVVEELLATICDELGISYPEGNNSIKVFVDRLNAYLIDAYSCGRKTVIIIEEAQNLSIDVLEQIRLLTNLETNQSKLLQIIMLGQPELRDLLSKPELQQLSQRITARYHIGALSEDEVGLYVNHRLSVAGAKTKLFPDAIMRQLYLQSRGIPRVINVICDRALLGVYTEGKNYVNKAILHKAAREVKGESNYKIYLRSPFKWVIAASIIAAGLMAIVLNFYSKSNLPDAEITHPFAKTENELQEFISLEFQPDISESRSEKMAFKVLFEQWGIFAEFYDSESACRYAQVNGLRCLKGIGNIEDLLRLNRPAVLKLHNENGQNFYIALTSLRNNSAHLTLGDEKKIVSVKEIEKKWLGDYVILWQAPPEYNGIANEGHRGPIVDWLENQLALINRNKARIKDDAVYDEELVRRVRKFQISKGLIPDGIVGPQTMIQLQNHTDNKGPFLIAKKEK